MSAWSEQKIALARKYWDEGLPTEEIGRRMCITKNAVVGAAHRYGFPGRVSPIRPRDPNKSRRKRAPTMTLVPLGAPLLAAKGTLPSVRPLAPTSPARTCQFPSWKDGKPTHVYCGEPARIGPYCVAHFMVTHVTGAHADAGHNDPTAPRQEHARGA